MEKIDETCFKILVGVFLVSLFGFLQIYFIFAQSESTGKAITSKLDIDDYSHLLENINKTYEISSNVLNSGYEFNVEEKSLLNFYINDKRYSLIVNSILNDKLGLMFLDKEEVSINLNNSKVIDLDGDKNYDIILTFKSFDKDVADIFVKKYIENKEVLGNYKELFDIDVGLGENKIEDAKDLIVYIKFINFGEGPSKINIEYSIVNANESEVYKGLDEKIVYTEDSVIKTFDFLNLPPGKYKISSTIFYGANQTAFSEKDFEVLGKRTNKLLTAILSLVGVVGLLLLIIFLYKKNYQRNPRD